MNIYEEYEDFETSASSKKESFLKRHGFLFGVVTSLVCFVIAFFLVKGFLAKTGQILVLGQTGASAVKGEALLDADVVEKLDEIYNIVNIYYYEDFEKEALEEALYKGLMEGLDDPYSVYYTKEEYEEMMVSTTGTYYGIGAGLTQNLETMEVTVSKVYRGTPSEEAGLKNGDILLYVGDIQATSMELNALVQKIRGEEGTSVKLTVYRPATEETLEFDVVRKHVELPSIEGELLDDGIGYIQILEFQSKTAEQFQTMVEELQTQGMKGLIVDVRANPGGLLSAVIDICDYILPKGTIVSVEDTFGNTESYPSDNASINLPMVVLIDESSASASEIFAGAMKDYNYAALVGKTTYGKGIVQNIVKLADGDAIKLTTAKYFTPKGTYIHGTGIAPDVEVDYEYSGSLEENYDKQYDSQFLKALEIMDTLTD